MTTVKVNFHNEQEERVLLSILESLEYDYELQYSDESKQAINEALKRSTEDSEADRVYSHEEAMKIARSRFGL
jgi:hypothetical protein